MRHRLLILAILSACLAGARATLVVDPAQPITERVTVQIIRVSDDAGDNTAPAFGDADEQALIFSAIDTIWAQAGIDIEFNLSVTSWSNTFALTGTPGADDPRSPDDLYTIVSLAKSEGITAADPLTINLFLVNIVPDFPSTSDSASNGFAFINANGITLWAGPSLTDFAAGRDIIASVLAHEIGHNLGLSHISGITLEDYYNLMNPNGNGEKLNAAQIATALASPFSVPIPEPATLALLAFATSLGGLTRLRYRKQKTAKF